MSRWIRSLDDRFDAATGEPLRVGNVWPPRLVVHHVAGKSRGRRSVSVAVTLWVRHAVTQPVEVSVRFADEAPVDDAGQPLTGLVVGRASSLIHASEAGADTGYRRLSLPVTWSAQFVDALAAVRWARQSLFVELSDGGTRRSFRWYLYLTSGAPVLPSQAEVHHWSTRPEARWVELPGPMTSAGLPPACWVPEPAPPTISPHAVEILSVFPTEPALGQGEQVVAFDGTLGALVPLPRVQVWPWGDRLVLRYWDTPIEGASGVRSGSSSVGAGPRTPDWEDAPCVWPQLVYDGPPSWTVIDLGNGAEFTLDWAVRVQGRSEPVMLYAAELRYGRVVGRWEGSPVRLEGGERAVLPLRCRVDRQTSAPLPPELRVIGRPLRGPDMGEHVFEIPHGPEVIVERFASPVGSPWVVIDVGTQTTSVALAWRDGARPFVRTLRLGESGTSPSEVAFRVSPSGDIGFADSRVTGQPFTEQVKLGLRLGDGDHPDCPDGVAAIEVARFLVKQLMLTIRARASWFPLHQARLLVAVSPRLARLPRFASSFREAFVAAAEEVLGAGERLVFAEEPFLAATARVMADLKARPLEGAKVRGYWMMDFGHGTTESQGVVVRTSSAGLPTLGPLSAPARLPATPTGEAIARHFYVTLADAVPAERFEIPEEPRSATVASVAARFNQASIRSLAQSLQLAGNNAKSVLEVAQGSLLLEDRHGDRVSLTQVMSEHSLAQSSVEALHHRVLNGGELASSRSFRLRVDGVPFDVPDWETVCAWVLERRVGEDDLISINGGPWERLGNRGDLAGELLDAEDLAVDETQEVPSGRWDAWVFPVADPESAAPPRLGVQLVRYLDASFAELERFEASLTDADGPVQVLVTGLASRLPAVQHALHARFGQRVGQVVPPGWREDGVLDAGADEKSIVVLGGGICALALGMGELGLDHDEWRLPVYVRPADGGVPWRLTDRLTLKPGGRVPLARTSPDTGGLEPEVRPLPQDTPLAGELELLVRGWDPDAAWEPYVVIGKGRADRRGGRRSHTTTETELFTEEDAFVLGPLSDGRRVRFERLLPSLPHLGDVYRPR